MPQRLNYAAGKCFRPECRREERRTESEKLLPGERWRRYPPPRARWRKKSNTEKKLLWSNRLCFQSFLISWHYKAHIVAVWSVQNLVSVCLLTPSHTQTKMSCVDPDILSHHQFNQPLTACFHYTQYLHHSLQPCQYI